jgi:hypothetical protein
MDTDEPVNRPPKQQLVSRLLKRRGIPVREYLPNGYRRPLVFKMTECSDHIGVRLSRMSHYRRAVDALTAAGYVFQEWPPAPGNGYGLIVTGRVHREHR